MSAPSSTVRDRVIDLLSRRPDLTPAHLVSAVPGISSAAAHQYISGKIDPSPNTDRHFQRALREIEAGNILRPQDSGPVHITEMPANSQRVRRRRDFYVIETTRRIQQVLTYCAEQSAIGICTADYGVGKTESVRYWRENDGRKTDHLLFEFDEFSSRNILDFIGCLADRMAFGQQVNVFNAGRVMRALCAALEEKPMLLIFDQCEMVAPRVLQVIRQMWDATRHAGVGVTILASTMLLERLEKSRMRDLGALSSRVAIWAALHGVQKQEAAAILRQEGISQIDDRAFDLLYRATGGSMRRLMAVADLLVTKHGGKPITEKTIEGVAANLWGLQIQSQSRAVA
jgi:DNA transposition AAA+ family ATPase